MEVTDGVGELDRLRADGQTFTAVVVGAVDRTVVSCVQRLIDERSEIHRVRPGVIVVLLPRPSNSVERAEQIAAEIRRLCAVAVGVAHSHPSATAREVVDAAIDAMWRETGSSVQPGGGPCLRG